MLTIALCSIQVQIELTLRVRLCLHSLRHYSAPTAGAADSLCLHTRRHTHTAHTDPLKGHMLISCELNLQQRKDNRSAQLTQKRKCSLRTQSHTHRLSHCTCSWRGIVPATPSSLSLCLSAPCSLFLCLSGGKVFCGCSFLSSLGLGLSTERPPLPFPWVATLFRRCRAPLACLTANTADRGLLTCRSAGPPNPFKCEQVPAWNFGGFFGGGVLCILGKSAPFIPLLLMLRMSVHPQLSN